MADPGVILPTAVCKLRLTAEPIWGPGACVPVVGINPPPVADAPPVMINFPVLEARSGSNKTAVAVVAPAPVPHRSSCIAGLALLGRGHRAKRRLSPLISVT